MAVNRGIEPTYQLNNFQRSMASPFRLAAVAERLGDAIAGGGQHTYSWDYREDKLFKE
jgi:hypothetical protein